MKWISTTAIIFFFIISFQAKANVAEINYLDYFKRTAKAEMYILDSFYTKAILVYHSVFKDYDKVFPEDAYLAAQVAAIKSDFKSTTLFLKKGFLWGLEISCMDSSIYIRTDKFGKYKRSINLERLKIEYDSLKSIFDKKINSEYSNMNVELIKCRNMAHKKINKPHYSWNEQDVKEFADSVRLYIAKLKGLIKVYGFPSIQKVRHNSAIHLLWDYSMEDKEFEEILWKALLSGDIHVKLFALYRDFLSEGNVTYNTVLQRHFFQIYNGQEKYKNYKYYMRCFHAGNFLSSAKIKQIDINRGKIGLVPFRYDYKIYWEGTVFEFPHKD